MKKVVLMLVLFIFGIIVGMFTGKWIDKTPEINSIDDDIEKLIERIHNQVETKRTIGDRKIYGCVLLENGQPLKDAEIRAVELREQAYIRPIDRGNGFGKAKELKELVPVWIEDRISRTEDSISTLSNENGTYEINGLGECKYDISAAKEGYSIRPINHEYWIEAGAEYNFKAHKIYDISADVIMPDGSKPEYAYVYNADYDQESIPHRKFSPVNLWTPSFGKVQVESNEIKLRATLGLYSEYRSNVMDVNISDLANNKLIFRLVKSDMIRIKVITVPKYYTHRFAICLQPEEIGKTPVYGYVLKKSNTLPYYSVNFIENIAYYDVKEGNYLICLHNADVNKVFYKKIRIKKGTTTEIVDLNDDIPYVNIK